MSEALKILVQEKIKDFNDDIDRLKAVMKFKDYDGVPKELLDVEKRHIKKLKEKITILKGYLNDK